MDIINIFPFIALFLVLLLIYYSIILLKRLNNEDLVVSLIFLHEKKIKSITLILVIGTFIFFIGQSYASFLSEGANAIAYNILGIVYSIALLYFVYGLQDILKSEVKE